MGWMAVTFFWTFFLLFRGFIYGRGSRELGLRTRFEAWVLGTGFFLLILLIPRFEVYNYVNEIVCFTVFLANLDLDL